MQNEHAADGVPSSSSKATLTSTATTPKDDELMIKSTVSDSFDTWTILTDKEDRLKSPADNGDRIEVLKNDATPDEEKSSAEDMIPRKPNYKTDHEPQTDDLSDGISIISECESTEQISPNSSIRDEFNTDDELLSGSLADHNSQTMSTVFTTNAIYHEVEKLRGRNRRRTSLQNVRANNDNEVVKKTFFPPMVERGLTGLFYVGVTVAILAFIGKLRYPEWQTSSDGKPISEIQQKLNDLELQNNLMRSEIDILSKQVNYLSSLKDAQGSRETDQSKQYNNRQGKTFKAWAGNGNKMNPVHITKEDLKKPYRCPSGEFVELAALCLEQNPNVENIVDYIKSTVNEGFEQTQTDKDNRAETIDAINILVGETIEHTHTTNIDDGANILKNKEDVKTNPYKDEKAAHQEKHFKQGYKDQSNYDKGLYHEKNFKQGYKNRDERDGSQHYAKYERVEKHEHSKENYKKVYDQSKEKTDAKYDNTKSTTNDKYKNSKERHDNRNNKNSKERFYNNKKPDSKRENKSPYSGKSRDSSGEWHERMMHQRESARRQHEQQRDNNNWYIERGDSREQMRSGQKPTNP